MTEVEKNIADGNLTQKEIIQLLLHNAQHMATREEVKVDIKELKIDLKADISKVEDRILKVEASLKQDISKVETSLKQDISKVEDRISKVETSLKQDISKVETSLKQDISKVEDRISKVETSLKQDISKISNKFDKIQWLIVATLLTVVFKDYLLSLFT